MLWARGGRVCRGKDIHTLCPPPCGQVAKELSGNAEVLPQGSAESPVVTSSSMALLLGGMAPHLKAVAAPLFSAEELEKDLEPGHVSKQSYGKPGRVNGQAGPPRWYPAGPPL